MGDGQAVLGEDGIPVNDCPVCGTPLVPEVLDSPEGFRIASVCPAHGPAHSMDPFPHE